MPSDTKDTLLGTLNSIKDRYDRYNELKQSSGTSIKQNTGLQDTLTTLKSKLANVKRVADTYDREYLDRVADKPLSGFWQSRGVSTLQDWILLLFFFMYTIISLGLVFLVITAADRSALFNGFMILSFAFSLGVMLTVVIVRFA